MPGSGQAGGLGPPDQEPGSTGVELPGHSRHTEQTGPGSPQPCPPPPDCPFVIFQAQSSHPGLPSVPGPCIPHSNPQRSLPLSSGHPLHQAQVWSGVTHPSGLPLPAEPSFCPGICLSAWSPLPLPPVFPAAQGEDLSLRCLLLTLPPKGSQKFSRRKAAQPRSTQAKALTLTLTPPAGPAPCTCFCASNRCQALGGRRAQAGRRRPAIPGRPARRARVGL